MTQIADLYRLPEDARIEAIGKAASHGQIVGVLLEKDQPEKIERYIRKVTTLYPQVVVLAQTNGPTPRVVTIKFGLKSS